MKLSQIDVEQIPNLSVEQKTAIVYGGFTDDGGEMDGAILLGSRPTHMTDRAKAGVKLYGEDRIKYFVPCGGVAWDVDGQQLTEAEFMAKVLMEGGVPEDMIVLDNESRTTKENMMCSTLQLSRKLGLPNMRRVLIVTSPSHVRRSVALAKLLMPRHTQIFGYPAASDFDGPDKWMKEDFMVERLEREIVLLRSCITGGLMDDIEF